MRTFDDDPGIPARAKGVPRRPARNPIAHLGQGRALAGEERRRMERGFARDLGHIRLHTDGSAGTVASEHGVQAFSYGHEIGFDRGAYRPGQLSSDLMLAHELAHALAHAPSESAMAEPAAERSADAAGVRALTRAEGADVTRPSRATLGRSGLALRGCKTNTATPAQRALDGSIPFTRTLALQALGQYASLTASQKDAAFRRYYPTGALGRLMAVLGADDLLGAHGNTIRDILQRTQRREAQARARALGLTNEAAMAQTQATFMHQRNVAAAQAAHGASPSASQVAAQQSGQVAQTTIAPSSSTLTPVQVAAWAARGVAAVATLVAHASANHASLGITAANFRVDVPAIENRGQGVIAMVETVSGVRRLVVGRPFIRLVEANPAYAMGTVVHELRGHPSYGPYGQTGTEYGLELYDKAAGRMPGYTRPTSGRQAEIDAYAYQETEIYSLLREVPYFTPTSASHGSVASINFDPAGALSGYVATIVQQWEPRVAQSLLRGLYVRFRLDPSVSAAALQAFAKAIRANYTGAERHIAVLITR